MAQGPESQTRMVSAGGRSLALLHDVEVMVEGGDLEDLGLRHPQLVGKRVEHRNRQAGLRILDEVEVFDQEIATPRPVAKQPENGLPCRGIERSPLGASYGRLNSLVRIP